MNNCQYQIIYETRDRHIKARQCQQEATSGGYCSVHRHSAELMEAARLVGYPAFTVAMLDNKPCYTISGGKLAWEGYAARHPIARHKNMMRKLAEMRESEAA